MSYHLLRKLLWLLPAEAAHELAMEAMRTGLVPSQRVAPSPRLQSSLWGHSFPHPVGLAAGFDKNALAVKTLWRLGFSFVEAGTVTPKAQPGNPKPRIFRLHEDDALINRLGFNNLGLAPFVGRVQKLSVRTRWLGGNVGKNKTSEDAVADYVEGICALAAHVDYLVVNISSPNTPGLRRLQEADTLRLLLRESVAARDRSLAGGERKVPLFCKIAPDLDSDAVSALAEVAVGEKIDGLVVSNTTIARPSSLRSTSQKETGGLSGRPLVGPSTAVLKQIYRETQGKLPLIGVGGIFTGEDAYAKIRAGASLVEIYTAFVYRGPAVVKEICKELDACLARDGVTSLSSVVGVDA